MDGVIRKYNATFSSLLQYTCPKQNMNIAEMGLLDPIIVSTRLDQLR